LFFISKERLTVSVVGILWSCLRGLAQSDKCCGSRPKSNGWERAVLLSISMCL